MFRIRATLSKSHGTILGGEEAYLNVHTLHIYYLFSCSRVAYVELNAGSYTLLLVIGILYSSSLDKQNNKTVVLPFSGIETAN